MELFITSHHTCINLWSICLENWRKIGFEGKINLITDVSNNLQIKLQDNNYEIHFEKGDWVTRLVNVLNKKNDNDNFVLITTDDIFVKDKDFKLLINTALEFLRDTNNNIFNLCYTYNRIYLKENKFVKKIDKISPHVISLRPTVFKVGFIRWLLNDITKNKKRLLTAADFEILGSLIYQRDNINAFGFSRKYSLKCDEAISKGKLKSDISKKLYFALNKKFNTFNFYEKLSYYSFLLIKEGTDIFLPRVILKFLIKQKLFWRIYE